ncbi:hypothetical protein BU23DRAFT_195666 [Bimuria novae-zelandiae CBS 107.79]|uniref:Uncharacterized protein n=1 Tax=Bimuria novae-zelandiae CBS 107.79 TaxID=1447943 RepID=A0A6A5V840_9PLEO|nr:hypothetical protein BU23DRAFT_195666 [Bimuria novae-zelandiae CBS 107.79]
MAEQTSTALGISNPYNAANLLAHGLKCAPRISMSQVPTTEQLRKEACDLCLNSTKGRGFTINTHHGVVFKIHSIMLIGGPQELEKVAFPVSRSFPIPQYPAWG